MAAVTIVTVRVCWESLGLYVYSTQPDSQCLYALHPMALSGILACRPWWDQSMLWRYSDRCCAYDFLLSVIWPSVLSHFYEDAGKPSVSVREFNMLACLLA